MTIGTTVNPFSYRSGRLHAEAVPVDRIAATVGTPAYVYSTAALEHQYRAFAGAFDGMDAQVCYAVKANANLAVVGTLQRLGAGADVVSGGELQVALTAGIDPSAIVFSGVGKTEAEIAQALDAGIGQINVESRPELEAVARVAAAKNVRAPIALRVNPDVDAATHEMITTGRRENKFGIEWTCARSLYADAARMPSLDVMGIAVHIGSQITDLEPFRLAFHRVRDLAVMLRTDGHRIRALDVGGGLGIDYGDSAMPLPAPTDYAKAVSAAFADLGCRIVLEPGRFLVGNAGILVTRVLYVKQGATRTFLIVDAAMNDLLRPALYAAHHAIDPVAEPVAGAPVTDVDVVGPICESTDRFASQRPMPPVVAGDLLVLRGTGAYAATMASSYNVRPLTAEVMVNDDRIAVVRARPTIDSMLAAQDTPPWFDEPVAADDPPAPRALGSGAGR